MHPIISLLVNRKYLTCSVTETFFFSTKVFDEMHDGYLICDVHFVYLISRVPTNGLVALQCNLFNVLPGNPPVE